MIIRFIILTRYITPLTYEYMEYYDFPCMVFHAPHKKNANIQWWEEYRQKMIFDLHKISKNKIICVENLFEVENYYMPLISPEDMLEFAKGAGVFVNADTTHYAQSGIDIARVAEVLGDKIKTVHLSDYIDGASHVYLGEGSLNFKGFFGRLNISSLHAVTVECALPYNKSDEGQTVLKVKETKEFIERFVI